MPLKTPISVTTQYIDASSETLAKTRCYDDILKNAIATQSNNIIKEKSLDFLFSCNQSETCACTQFVEYSNPTVLSNLYAVCGNPVDDGNGIKQITCECNVQTTFTARFAYGCKIPRNCGDL